MLILGYPNRTVGSSIVIPPFHTGHLGFVPETEVQIYLKVPYTEGATNCEIVITPYESNTENIMQLSCTMKDQPGVVGRLINVIASMKINIVSLASSGIDYLNSHRVDMILDWSTSEAYQRNVPSSQSVQRHYRDYHSIFPINIQRYVELFERIIENCESVLALDSVAGISLPMITLRPISAPGPVRHIGVVTVKHHPLKPLHAEIELPTTLINRLKAKLKTTDESLLYILLSETETRTLRAFFPRPDIIPRIVHLGFYHFDMPGALSTILGPLARANFNILTSLLRQNKDGSNVLEAVLEYRDTDEVPYSQNEFKSPEAEEQVCNWVAKKMMEKMLPKEVEGLQSCNLQIGLPRYPRREHSWGGRVSFNGLLKDFPISASTDSETGSEVADMDESLREEDPERVKLRAIVRIRREHTNPTIFLSYPHGAKDHAELVKRRLRGRYDIIEYQEPDAEVIVDQVIQRIGSCDYFIGIWHPENETSSTASPWLHFEYAIALVTGKKAIVVHSEKLDQKEWKRINPGIAQPEYSDVKFESVTVPLIDQYCKEHFVENYQPLHVVARHNF
jgi:ACT domain-containing protein